MSENKELQAQIENGFGEFSWLHLGGECYSVHHGYHGNLELTFKCYDLDVHFRLACPPAFALLLKGSSPTIQDAIAQVEEGLPEWIHLADDPPLSD